MIKSLSNLRKTRSNNLSHKLKKDYLNKFYNGYDQSIKEKMDRA